MKQKFVRLGINRADELAHLNKQLIEDEGHSNPMSIEELQKRMSEWLSSNYMGVALEQDGNILSYALWRDDGEYYYLRHLFTQRSHRRKGYARILLEHIESELLGHKPIRVEVLSGNADALSFYKSLGYTTYANTMQKTI